MAEREGVPVFESRRPHVSVHQSRWGWSVEVWLGNKLLYTTTQDKRPAAEDKRALLYKFRGAGMTKVFDLQTGEEIASYSLPPREAVVAAYRQLELKDFCWWNKNDNVPPVEESEFHVTCGHFTAKKEKT